MVRIGRAESIAAVAPGDDEPGDDEPGDDEPGDDEPGDNEPGDDEPAMLPEQKRPQHTRRRPWLQMPTGRDIPEYLDLQRQ